MRRPYNRSLHPQDYEFLPHAERLRVFERDMTQKRVPHRDWCEHRLWEYASIMQQLEELQVPRSANILDVGSGGSFFPPYLATQGGYPIVVLTDSMEYGDITADVAAQRKHYGVELPLFDLPAENMWPRPEINWFGHSDAWDVVMCISTIEHVAAHDVALYELWRVTKPGGLIFITSDYFENLTQWEASPSRYMQLTPYREEYVRQFDGMIDADFVGELDFGYRGDFVHNHSFVNICMRKRCSR